MGKKVWEMKRKIYRFNIKDIPTKKLIGYIEGVGDAFELFNVEKTLEEERKRDPNFNYEIRDEMNG